MLESDLTYSDVLQGELDEQCAVALNDAAVKAELKARHVQ